MGNICDGCHGCGSGTKAYDNLLNGFFIVLKEIVDKHGGTICFDNQKESYHIAVPNDQELAFADELKDRINLKI